MKRFATPIAFLFFLTTNFLHLCSSKMLILSCILTLSFQQAGFSQEVPIAPNANSFGKGVPAKLEKKGQLKIEGVDVTAYRLEGFQPGTIYQYSFDGFQNVAGSTGNGWVLVDAAQENLKKSLSIKPINESKSGNGSGAKMMAPCIGSFSLSANTSQVCDGGDPSNPTIVNFSGFCIADASANYTATLRLGMTLVGTYNFTTNGSGIGIYSFPSVDPPAGNQNYQLSVEQTSPGSCVSTNVASQLINCRETITVNLTGNTSPYCNTTAITLNATKVATEATSWDVPVVTNPLLIGTTTWTPGTGVFTGTGTNTSGLTQTSTVAFTARYSSGTESCPTTNTQSLDIKSTPQNASISTNAFSNTICQGGTVTLTASSTDGSAAGYTYNWDNGLGSGAVQMVSPASTTTYTVSATNGCSPDKTATITITVIPTPSTLAPSVGSESKCTNVAPTATLNGTALGSNEKYLVTASLSSGTATGFTASATKGAGQVIESNAVTNTTMAVATVTYAIKKYHFGPDGIDNGGAGDDCIDPTGQTYVLTVNPLPFPTIAITETSGLANDGIVTSGTTVTLDAGSYSDYLWSPGGAVTQSIVENPTMTTVYSVTVTDANGCQNSTSATINVYASPLYVNDNSLTGDTYTSAVGDNANLGTAAAPLASISFAEGVASAGEVIYVDAGTYAENVVVTKSLTINGPNATIDPCSGSRVAEAIVTTAVSAIDFEAIFYINANVSNASIKGFTIDGDNTALTSGFLGTNGADIDAAEGISSYETGLSNLTVSNNIIQNLSYFGVTLYDYPTAAPSSGHVISNNKFQDLGTYDPASNADYWGGGVLLYNNQYAAVTDNCMTNVRLGVQTGNFYQANPGAPASQLIDGNTMQVRRVGVFHNLHYNAASPFTLSNNTVTGLANVNESGVRGVLFGSLSVGSFANNNTIDLSTVTSNSTGYEVWNVKSTSPVDITGGTISNVNTGLFLNNYEGYASNAGDGAHAAVSGLSITPNASGIGIRVLDSPSSTTHAAVSLDINAGVVVNGGTNGISVENTNASISGGSLDNLAISTVSGNFVQLVNNAGDLNATTATFDGSTGASMSLTQLFASEDKILHKIDDKTLGFVTVKSDNSYVTDIASPTATNNDYTRIRNAVELSGNNRTVNLKGSFDWTETNAAASWALGNDEMASTGDDYSILVPANLNGVTFTAPEGIGSATIEGPGDNPSANLEGVLYFDGAGDNQGWTMSNVVYDDFDLPIGMFYGDGGSDAYNNTTITNNTFNIATDLNVVVAPADPNQNIGIHYAFGTNQTISNNIFNVPGNGVSNGSNFSTTAVMQSNTSGGAVYNGLQITGNTINILNAQSANPEVILGIWENGHAHTSNITISNNQFLNLAGGNNPASNLQRAFRVTSHSGASSTVTYSGNTAKGANIGFQWLAGQNFGAQMPIAMTGNILNGNNIGMLVQSNGKATLSNNDFDDVTDNTRDVQVQLGSVVSSTGGNSYAGDTYYIENLSATAINISTDAFDETNNFRRTDRIYGALDNAASGLIRFNTNNLYVSTPGTGSSDETIPAAVAAAAASGDVIHIESGNYLTGADATTKEVTFVPGSSPGCVTLSGNLVLTAGDALAMDIDGTTACTGYDQFTVNGTVTLGGANLVLTLGFSPASGDPFTIISNDGVDAVVGQFAQGATITVMGTLFGINYQGGDGNDVVLTACGGGLVHNGVNNYCTIQAAIDAANPGDVITVDAGTYVEDIIVNKSLTILGPNAGTCGDDMRPNPEAIIHPATSSPFGEIIKVQASGVTIDGFTIDGDNPSLMSGIIGTNGADLNAAEAVTVYVDNVNNTVVQNNIIKNLTYFGVTVYGASFNAPTTSGHLIDCNKFQDLGTYLDPEPVPANNINFWGGGVLLYNDQYANVTNNLMENVRIGVQTGNYHDPNTNPLFQNISNNTIQARRRGIFYNLHTGNPAPWTLDNNTITGLANANETGAWEGILMSSLSTAVGVASNNDIDGSAISGIPTTGISVWNDQTAPLIQGGTITGVQLGINVNNYEGYPTTGSNAGNTSATIEDVTITGTTIAGIRVNDNPLNSNSATVFADISGVTISGSTAAGILVFGNDASANIHDNDASIFGNPIGIDVDGGNATVTNNHIYNNGIGVRFTNAGTGTVHTNKFQGATSNGKDIQATATAGAITATPNNWFAGTTYGVENLSAANIDATLSYWNAATGPGPVGVGGGANVSTNVTYCPILSDAPTAFGGTGTVLTGPSSLSYTTVTNVYTEGMAITPNTATVSGTPPFIFSAHALPPGLSISSTTGEITGTPTAPTLATNYTVTATNDCGSTTTTINITVNAVPGMAGPCKLLDETFDVNPNLSNTNVSGAWYPDRYRPAQFIADAGQLRIDISASDGAQVRPGAFSGAFYNTQGRKINQCGKCVTILKGDLHIPADWATKKRRTDMWATAFDAADAISFYTIIGFANIDGASPVLRFWNGTGWTNTAVSINYGGTHSFEAAIVGTDIEYKIDGNVVGTVASGSSTYFGDVIMQAYNFNDNTLGVSYDPSPNNSYSAYWDNIITENGTGKVVTNLTTGDKFCSIQAAVNEAQNNDMITVSAGTYTENVTVNKPLTIKGANFGTAGCSASRDPESVLNGGAGTAFTITSNGVTIDGFEILGATGVASTGYTNIGIRNNKMTVGGAGVNAASVSTSTGNTLTIEDNCIDLTTQVAGGTATAGIFVNGATGTASVSIDDNTVTDAFYGVLMYGINTTPQTVVSDDTITGAMQGVAVVNTIGGPLATSNVAIENLNATAFSGNNPSLPAQNFHAGIYTFTAAGTTGANGISLSVNNSTIDGTGKPNQASGGIYLADFSGGGTNVQTITVSNSSIINNKNRGVDARGKVHLSLTGNTLTNNGNDAFGTGGNDGFTIIAQQNATITASNNFITLPATSTTPVYGLSTGNGSTNAITAVDNSILLNGNANPSSKLANSAIGTGAITATCNWWDPTCTNLPGLISGTVTYLPFLSSGTDSDLGTAGFQPSPGTCLGNIATLSGVAPSSPAVCDGATVGFTASGLVNGSNTFDYTVTGPGGSFNGTQTVTVVGGAYTFPAAAYPVGTYNITINSITIGGCTVPFTMDNTASFTVNPLTIITTQPMTATYCKDAPAAALTVLATGTPTITYEWFSNTTNSNTGGTSVGTGASYTPPTGTVGSVWYYAVASSSTCNAATTDAVEIMVTPLTNITTQPIAATYCKDEIATALTVAASGTPTITYEWFSNTVNSDMGGTSVGTGTSYTPSTGTVGSVWYYAVATSSTCGMAISDAVEVMVTPLTAITTQPVAATYCKDETATALTVAASGTPTITYEWFSNTTNSNTGGTSVGMGTSYVPSTATVGSVWYYAEATSSSCDAVASDAVEVKINALPTSNITSVDQFCSGDLTITFTGASPWDFTYSDGTNSFNVTGASSPHTIPNLGVGNYTVTALTDANGCDGISLMGSTFISPVRNMQSGNFYATIQGAINGAAADNVLEVCAGTYTENISINKPLTINGPNVGVAGTGMRVAEAVLLNCTIDIANAGNTTLDGLHIKRTDGATGPTNQLELDGGGTSTVQNCIFERLGSNTGQEIRAIATTTAGGPKVVMNNKITGDVSGGLFGGHKSWARGIYVDGGPFTVTFTGNTVENCRTGMNIDDYNNSLAISANTLNNNGTHISIGAAVPTTGSFTMGANNFINNAASTMVNLSNVAESFRLDITSSSLNGTPFSLLGNTALFEVEARMAHKEVSASKKGKVIYKANNQYVNNFTVPVTKIDKIQNSIKYGDAGDIINLEDGTYFEKLTVDKSNLTLQGVTSDKTLYIIEGTGLGVTSGIYLNNGITNTTIKNLTIQKFTGAGGNANAGIYANAGNNNLTVTNVALLDNPTASGFYANGPIDNVSITNSMVANNGTGARGIVIWNGMKTNITITGNTVTNNSCCGIELQDGDASAVNVSNNTIDIGVGDNAIGLVGLNPSVGANTVNTNTITGGGRFGIEIKNPAGGVTVNGNSVSLTTVNTDLRDRAGIAVFRRSVTGSNIDVPNGVTVTGNTVTGYTQTLPEEGFGIVIEGTNHVVSGNTINNCNIGIQEQGGAHANPFYPNITGPYGDGVGNGAQGVGLSPNYFGRGNAPFACGNTIGSNNFSSNGTNTRTVVMNSYGLVTNTTSGEYFCNIQAAVSDAQTLAGHTLNVSPATYNEQVLVTKGVTIKGVGMTQPIVDFTGTPSGKLTLFDVSANNVTIENINFNVDLSKLSSAVIASDANLDNITIKDNEVDAYGTPPSVTSSDPLAYGNRNAFSINYGGNINYRVATGGVNSVIFTSNTVNGTLPSSFFRSGIALDEGGATITGNTLQTINHDVLVRFAGNGAVTVSNNNMNGGGAEFADQNAGSSIALTYNTFTGAGAPGAAMLRVKNNYAGVAHNINNNTFNNFEWAVSLENMNNVTLDGNTFSATSGTARAVVVNTKSISSNSNTIVQVPVGATLTNNNFNGNGTALTFQNHDSDNDSYGTFTLGGVGNENDFASTLANFIVFDGQTGSSNGSTFPVYPNTGGWPTTMACWDTDLTVENNLFDVGGGLELPAAMDATDRNVLETKLTHDPDNICLGRIRYFYPVHNVTQNTYHALIQDAIDAPSTMNGDEIEVPAGTYAENIVISKSVTLNGPNANIDPCSMTPRNPEAILTTAVADIEFVPIVYINPNTSNVTIKGFTIDGDNTLLTSGFTSTNGADIDAAEGIATYETGVNNLTVSNNIIQNLSYFGITLYDYPAGVPSSGHVISNNLIRNLGTYDASSNVDYWGGGVLIYNNQYAAITDNCMTNVRLGIQTGNFHLANPGAPASQVISGNSIQARRLGIFHNLHYSNASPLTLSNNLITGLSDANETGVRGIFLSSLSVGSLTQGNTIDLSGIANSTGVEVWNVSGFTPATIASTTVSNVNTGLFINNYEGYASDAPDGAHATISDFAANLNPGGTGIRLLDSPSSTTHAAVSLTIGTGVGIQSGATGLVVENSNAIINGSTLGDIAFNSTSGNYIELLTNGGDLDGTSATFDGLTGSMMSLPQLFATEDKIYHRIDAQFNGFVTVKANNSYVTDIATPVATNNDYTRIRNAVELSAHNWTVNLKGTFDWTETNAAASWELGNDNSVSTGDDYSILVPADLNGVTFTAPEGLGTATIHGPGDLAAANLEGVLYFDGAGDNQGWTMSNVVYDDFDLPIGMFFGDGGSDAYNNTTITNNTFNIATDLNVVDAPADPNQNIGIHYAFGTNQTISNNTFNVPGDGVSNGTNYSTTAVMQSNTSGGAVYDGLQITDNTINVLNAQSANPQVILGIWENGHAHTSNITISNNQFLNLAGGNDPALNLQRAFRVTSHSGASSTVTYSGNTVQGANIGFQWIAGSNFSTQMPIAMTGNVLNGNTIGMLVQSNGKADLTNNDFDDATDNVRDVQVQLGSVVTSAGGNSFAGDTYYIENLSATAINVETDNFDEIDNFRRSDKLYDALDAPASGLVVFEANNHYVSDMGTGASDETITNAITAAAASGDLIHIEDGNYATGLDATGKDIEFLPASTDAGCIALGANMVLNAGDELAININGATTSCTEYDQILVNGSVNLGGATLSVDLGSYMPSAGDEITIINNDAVDAVVGQFAQGPTINVGGYIFSINYAGGSGNDVVLKSCGAGDVEVVETSEKFCSIQAAIDDADTDAGQTIVVGAGTYNEQVTVNKAITLQGANAGSPGCGARMAESTIAGGIGTAITIASSNVTIDGFEITGASGVAMTSVNNVNVSNNLLNVGAGGIVANAIVTTAGNTLTIEDNCIDVAAQIVSGNPTGGVYINGATGSDAIIMKGNTVTDGFYGYVLNGVNTTAPTEVKDGTITGVLQGVAVVNTAGGPLAPANVSITDMTMSGFVGTSPNPANNFHAGVYTFTAAPTTPATGITLTVNNCDIDGTKANGPAGAAIYLGDFSTGGTVVQNVTIDGGIDGTITNNENRGVDARGYVNASISNVSFTNNGGNAWDAVSGNPPTGNDGFTIIAQRGATVTATGNTITHPAMSATPVTALLTGNTPASTIIATSNNILANGNPQGRGAVNGAGNTLNATLNWWGNANGPSGVGPGTGASVSSDVIYCPWMDGLLPGGNPIDPNTLVAIDVTEMSGVANDDGIICEGESVTLDATTAGATVYAWTPSGSTGDITVSPASTTTYEVTVTIPGCTITKDEEITVNPLPTGSLTAVSPVCYGEIPQLTFTASVGTGAFSLVINGVTYPGITSGVAFPAAAAITANTVYDLTSVSDANSCNTSAAPVSTVTVNLESTPPTWVTAANDLDETVECSDAAALMAAQALVPIADDNCTLVLTPVKTPGAFVPSMGCAQEGTYTNTWVVTDESNNVSTVFTQVITVTDNTAPTWTTTAGDLDETVECSDAAALVAAQAMFPVAADLCDGDVSNIVKVPGAFVPGMTCSQEGTYTNTWTVTDDCGNVSAVYTQVITVTDNAAPTWTTTAGDLDETVECSDAAALVAAQAMFPVAADLCDGDVSNIIKVPGAFVPGMTCPQEGTYTNTWTVTDECGNVSDVYTQVITVTDNTAPAWTTTAGDLDETVECSDAAALVAAQAMFPVANDLCDGDVSNIVKVPGAFVAGMTCPQEGTYTNTWTVTDECGNVSDVYTQVITVTDNTAPTWATSAGDLDQTVECSNTLALAAAQSLYPVANDLCDGDVSNIVKVPGAFVAGMTCSQEGTYTNTWTVMDDCGNVSAVFTQVISVTDNTAPTWTTAAGDLDETIECSDAVALAAAQALFPVASDLCDGDVSNVVKVPGAFVAGMSCANEGTYTNTWTVTDECGNVSAVYTQVITLTDNTAPTVNSTDFPGGPEDSPDIDNFNCGDVFNRTTDPGGCIVPLTITKPTWLDNCDASISRTQSTDNGTTLSNFPGIPGYVSGNFPGGTTIVTFNGTDDCGNVGTCSITINVTDNLPPTVVGCTANQSAVTASGQCTAIVSMSSPVFNDNCAVTSVAYTATGATPFSGTGLLSSHSFNAGVTTVQYTVMDAAGNSNTSCSFTVTVTDNQAPSITCPAPVTVDANAAGCTATGVSLGSPVVVDNCSPTVGNNAPMTFPLGITNVVWTATDANGPGTATCTQVVTVEDAGTTLTLSNLFIEGYMISATEMTPVHLNAVNAGGSVPGNPSPTSTQCDYITVELRDAMAPHALAYSQEVILSTTGSATVNFPCAAIGNNYYIVIKGRNIIETWSASPQAAALTYSYNFDNATDAYGSNMVTTAFGVPAIYSGDIDDVNMNGFGDGEIEFQDFDMWVAQNGFVGYYRADVNGDGEVEFLDYDIFATNNGIVVVKP